MPTPPPCPDCSAPLTVAPTCPACGLRLTGHEAARLWEVDLALAGMETHRAALVGERELLLAVLRSAAGAPASGSPAAGGQGQPWDAPSTVPPPKAAPVREWTPQRVQNTLLALGGLLLTVAGIVFAAVTYDRLGAGGRAAILLLLTGIAAVAAPRLKARGLGATAETVSAVTLALAALDAYGLRTLGLAESAGGLSYAAGSCLALSALSGLYAAAVPLRLPRYAGVVLAHLPVPLLLARADATAGSTGLVLSVVAAADLAAVVLLARRSTGEKGTDLSTAARACGVLAAPFGLLIGGGGALVDNGRVEAALSLVVFAALAALIGLLVTGAGRFQAHVLPAPLLAAAALALSTDLTTDAQQPIVIVAMGLIAMQVAAMLPFAWRSGPVTGALAATVIGLVTQAEVVAQALLLPVAWLAEPWTLDAGRGARAALSPDRSWDGTVVALVVVTAAAVAVAGAGLALDRLRLARLPVAALVVLAALVLPLGLATSYPLAVVLLVAVAVGLLTVGAVLTRPDLSLGLLGAGTLTAVLTAVWSTADRDATLLVLPVLTLALTGVATRRAEAAGAAGVFAGAALAAGGAARGLHVDQVGGLLLLAPAALVALTFGLDRPRRLAVEVVAVLLGCVSLGLTAGDAGWLSWALAVLAVIALADALHADRRLVAAAGALLLSASSWVRLADAGVGAPEPYVLPLGLVALVLGHLRLRRNSALPSFGAYGPGLSALLLPSLLASLDDGSLTRPLLLGGAALVVLLVGAKARLQAPLVLGAGVLVVDALQLLGPYAAALPRWTTLGAAGLLLVTVGATFEQRRRDVARLRERYEALA